ncbi:MAG: diguanylate cyclase, partial [Thermoleophilaceae bacterium]
MSVLFRRKERALEVPVPGAGMDPAVMARAQAGLWAGGALIALLVAILPHPHEAYTFGFLVVAGIATATAGIINARAGRLPRWILHLASLVGTALISLCIYFSGERLGAPSTDNEMLYLWIALYSAYFFSLRQAGLQLAWVAVAYWVVLAISAPSSVFAARWAETVGTLAVAAVLVQALRNRLMDLVDRLADAARTDPLTGLQNRRGFEESFGVEVERARRHNRPLTVLLGDLDHFKRVNDRLGHPAGDVALKRAGELLRTGRRRIDLVARAGGEEFAVILPETGEGDAFLVSERMRTAVERAFEDSPVPITMTFGLATFPGHGTTADALLSSADQALYAAKELGRNRTVIFSEQLGDATSQPGDREVHLDTLLALAEAIDLRDSRTADHSKTVGRYSGLIAAELGLGPGHVRRIEIAGRLHDVGKVGLPDSILRKPGPLDDAEWEAMRRHPQIGADILGSGHFEDIRGWILAHHESPDGKGYPFGLSGEEIPLEARILSAADAYEAMTADRVYRAALGVDQARDELGRCAGSQFDPRVVGAFLRALQREDRQTAAPAAAVAGGSDPAGH